MLYCRIYVSTALPSQYFYWDEQVFQAMLHVHICKLLQFCASEICTYISEVQKLESIEKCAHVKHTSHMGRSYAKHLSLSLMTLRLDTHVFLDGEGHDQRWWWNFGLLCCFKHLISCNAFTASPIGGNYEVIENAAIWLQCALIKMTAPSVFNFAKI